MKSVLVLFAEGSEELEAVTIVNILRRAGVAVTLAGLHKGPLSGARNIAILPDASIEEVLHRDFDMVVLPGGQPGTDHLKTDPRVMALLKRMAQAGKLIGAICAAPTVLSEAGLLSGRQATCYPGYLKDDPTVNLKSSAVVEDGQIITSRGPGTAMDFALHLAERLVGPEVRLRVEASLVR